MSYHKSDRRLSHIAKLLPGPAMASWCKAANQAADQGLEHNDCVKAGWAIVDKAWERIDGRGRYVRKDNPTGGDVHVNVPLGSTGAPGPKRKPTTMGVEDLSGTEDADRLDANGDPIVEGSEGEDDALKFETEAQVCKVDESLGLVFGWAIVCTKNGEPYWDLQNDHIPDASMLKAAAEFMQSERAACDMHARDENGAPVVGGGVVFAFPMTKEIAEAMEIVTKTTGLMIAMKPNDPEVLAKFKSGEYTGFSIGGSRERDEVVH